jgi:hypothetical protein
MAKKRVAFGLLMSLTLCLGCDKAERAAPQKPTAGSPSQDARKGVFEAHRAALAAEEGAKRADKEARGAEQAADRAGAPAAPLARKIIYTANLQLIVEDFEKADRELADLIKRHKSLLAQSEITGSAGSPRHGQYRIRVPLDQLDEFLRDALGIGVPQKNSLDSEDLTDKYYDLEAKIKNDKAEEATLRTLLEKVSEKKEEFIALRRELRQIRGEIDVEEGQLRRLANLSSLATVNIQLQEVKDYVPPQAPTFGNSLAGTFSSSWGALVSFGKGVLLVLVALVPWLPLILIVTVPAWLFVRRWRVQSAAAVPVAEEVRAEAPSA